MSNHGCEKIVTEIKNILNETASMFEKIILVFFAVMMIFTFLIKIYYVSGNSMVPTLKNNDKIITSKLFYTPENNDVIVFDTETAYVLDYETAFENAMQKINTEIVNGKRDYLNDEDVKVLAESEVTKVNINGVDMFTTKGADKRIVKRVIAVEGQEVNVDFNKAKVYIDGKELFEPYLNTLTYNNEFGFSYPFTVPKGFVFAMGDNRGQSIDSRHPNIGLVPVESIVGKAVFRVYPFESFGIVS